MNIVTVSAPTFETSSFGVIEQSYGKHRGSRMFQFWGCTLMGCFMLMLGAWLLHNSKSLGPQSMAGDISSLLAMVIWLCVPTFGYFAWSAFRTRHENAISTTY